jgi:glutamate-1-semialdehyde 2,1-aminomutase
MKFENSQSNELFSRANSLIPGGVNSPVRAFKAVGGTPRFIARGEGAYIWDVEGKRYIDYIMSWGALILGHAHPNVVSAIKSTAELGTSFGAPTVLEIELAELVQDRFPVVERLRLVSSGTEAVMTALRLARAVTGRNLMVKFDGCYHGHSDALLVKAGSGLATMGIAGSAGVPEDVARMTLSLPYNDIESVENTFSEKGEEIAGVIVEPIPANMGVVLPKSDFLPHLRDLTKKYRAVLIFDEVITGFRVARGGACELFGIEPDLVCLGKILGGGMPIGAVGGKRGIMEMLAPLGPVYQAGTLSGNPVSVSAGIATLKEIDKSEFYRELAGSTAKLASGLREVYRDGGVAVTVNSAPGLLTLFFTPNPVTDFASAQNCDREKFSELFHKLLRVGVHLPPSGYEAWFISEAHTAEVIDETFNALE